MAPLHQHPIPVDALPVEVGDAYSNLLDWLADWLTDTTTQDSPNLIDYFERQQAACDTPEMRIRYLSRLNMQGGTGGEPYPYAAELLKMMQDQVDAFRPLNYDPWEFYYPFHDRQPFSDEHFYGWLAVRLLEAVCAYAGNSSLRASRKNLWAEWETIRHNTPRYQVEDANTTQLFSYLFGVLVPFARGSRTQSLGNVAEQLRKTIQRPTPAAKPPTPPPEPKPQILETLCQQNLTPADVRALLVHLGAVDEQTGRWELGDIAGKGAKLKSAFPAAYRALADARLMLSLEGPNWRRIFMAEFGVSISLRMSNYDTRGQASQAFQDYYTEAKRWITVWRSNH